MEPEPPALGARSPPRWTTREVPKGHLLPPTGQACVHYLIQVSPGERSVPGPLLSTETLLEVLRR